MNIAWSRKKLSPAGHQPFSGDDRGLRQRKAYDCVHNPGEGRELLTPLLRRSYRVAGKPRSEIVFRPAIGIRTCCLADHADPMPRIQFWGSFDYRLAKAPPWVLALKDWMRREIEERVAVITAAEELLAAFYWMNGDTIDKHLRSAERRSKHIARAHSHVADYLRTREPGETPEMWKARKNAPPKPPPPPPPPRDYSYVNFNAGWNGPIPADCRVLGLTWPFTAQEAKRAYRAAVLVHHPDRGGTQAAFIEVQAAYERVIARVVAGGHGAYG